MARKTAAVLRVKIDPNADLIGVKVNDPDNGVLTVTGSTTWSTQWVACERGDFKTARRVELLRTAIARGWL